MSAVSGLTAKQAWTAQHIGRCPGCGAWMVLTERHGGKRPAICVHLTPKSATTRREVA